MKPSATALPPWVESRTWLLARAWKVGLRRIPPLAARVKLAPARTSTFCTVALPGRRQEKVWPLFTTPLPISEQQRKDGEKKARLIVPLASPLVNPMS